MISRASMKQQLKGNKMALPKPRPKNLKKKKIGDDLVSGIKSFFTGSKKKVPENNKSPIRKLADAKTAKKNKLIKSQKESTKFMGKKADATVDPRIVRKAKPKKGPVVTKEQLKKSGLSLRDYMNFQQGKTRKKGSVVPKRVAPSAGAGNVKIGDKRRNVPVKKKMGGGMMNKKVMGYSGGGLTKGMMSKNVLLGIKSPADVLKENKKKALKKKQAGGKRIK